jgi:hypothetical protein
MELLIRNFFNVTVCFLLSFTVVNVLYDIVVLFLSWGAYILKISPPPWEGNISRFQLGERRKYEGKMKKDGRKKGK